MHVVAIIPARLDSKRLPGKVLREVGGKPLIRWVWERVARAARVDEVHVATDSPEIEEACRAFTPNVHRSQARHICGTDRAAEAVRELAADVVLNIQCDEPMMDPELVDAVIALFEDPDVRLASAGAPIRTVEELADPNVVKVVNDLAGDALFFSRAAIPWPREHPPIGSGPLPDGTFAAKHIGIYGYRNADLQKLAALPPTRLELLESLEQLRALEHGWKIRMIDWDYQGIDIDTERDLEKLLVALRADGELPD